MIQPFRLKGDVAAAARRLGAGAARTQPNFIVRRRWRGHAGMKTMHRMQQILFNLNTASSIQRL
jgi:hypothetical protein